MLAMTSGTYMRLSNDIDFTNCSTEKVLKTPYSLSCALSCESENNQMCGSQLS